MGPQRQTSTSSDISALSARTGVSVLAATAMSTTPHGHRVSLPPFFPGDHQQTAPVTVPSQYTHKTRVRKARTQEIPPKDDQALMTLGMSPFMIGQDATANQNRLVRNEAIFTKHFLDLKRSVQQAEATRMSREENIYHLLSEHKAVLNDLSAIGSAARTSSLRGDPDFVALFEAHADMRTRLDRLTADVLVSMLSTQKTMARIEDRIDKMASGMPAPHAPTPTSTPTPMHEMLPILFTPPQHTGTNASPSSTTQRPDLTIQRKRRREDAGITAAQSSSMRGEWHSPRAPVPDTIDRHTDVIYGPISAASPYIGRRGGGDGDVNSVDDVSGIHAIASEAVRDVGLDAHAVRSVRYAHGDPAFLAITFFKPEQASRFIELVGLGSDGHAGRRASLADVPGGGVVREPGFGAASERARSKFPIF